jgi:hypothetical protein
MANVEETIDSRVAAAFADILPATSTAEQLLNVIQELVRAVWMHKVYAALPKDKTKVPDYFLDAELEQFLNDAIEECHAKVVLIAERAKRDF